MKKGKLVSFVIVFLIVSLSCNFLFPGNGSHLPDINGIGQSASNLPVLDPTAPLPSPGAAQLRTLLADEPGLVTVIADLETAEQAAMKAAVADLQAHLGPTSSTLDFVSLVPSLLGVSPFMIPASARQSTSGDALFVSYSQPGVIQQAGGGISPAALIGLLSSMFTDIFSLPAAFPNRGFTQTEKEGLAVTKMSMEIGKSEDGSSHFGMGLQSETTENGVPIKTDMSAVIDGQRCPTAEGQVSFSIKARISSVSGGTGTTQDLTTFVRATVNDDAEIASSTFDVIQGTTQVKDGRQVYVETGDTFKYGPDLNGGKESNWRLNQKTDNVTQKDVNQLDPSGLQAALELGLASLTSAMNTWQSGGCTTIVATSPGTVQKGSTTAINVNIISKFDGTNAPSKLKATLTGAESINPTSLARTPGTLTYTAPNENGKSAAILLTATSRRGKAKLELSASTGGKLSASGNWGAASLTGIIDSLNNPFTLMSTGGGDGSCNGKVVFSGGSTGGTVSCSQTCAGLDFVGDGSYKITTTENGGTISGDCSSYLPASGGLDTPDSEPINVTLQPAP